MLGFCFLASCCCSLSLCGCVWLVVYSPSPFVDLSFPPFACVEFVSSSFFCLFQKRLNILFYRRHPYIFVLFGYFLSSSSSFLLRAKLKVLTPLSTCRPNFSFSLLLFDRPPSKSNKWELFRSSLSLKFLSSGGHSVWCVILLSSSSFPSSFSFSILPSLHLQQQKQMFVYSRTRSHTHMHLSPRVSVLSFFFVSPLLTHGKQNIPHAHSFCYLSTTTDAASFAAALGFDFPSVCDWHSATCSTPLLFPLPLILTTSHIFSRVCTSKCVCVCVSGKQAVELLCECAPSFSPFSTYFYLSKQPYALQACYSPISLFYFVVPVTQICFLHPFTGGLMTLQTPSLPPSRPPSLPLLSRFVAQYRVTQEQKQDQRAQQHTHIPH